MRERYIFFFILGVDTFILLFQTSQLSISYAEAKLLYGDPSFLQYIIRFSLDIFGQNDFGLRFVMILFHLLSAVLMYEISTEYIKTVRNRLWVLVIFVLLPGVVSAAVIVNSAGVLLFGLLLFIYLQKNIQQKYLNVLLFTYAFVDISFAYLFLALSIYYIFQGKRKLFIYMLGLYSLTSYFYGFEISGFPTGYFLDTIGVYSAIFTPIIFIYLSYALYRRYFSSQRDIIWCISTVVFLLSLLLSFRQKLPLEHFAPYLILALPLAAQTFISSYRVRLKQYRTKYRFAFVLSFVLLALNTLIVFFNQELYKVLEKPSQHFAYDSNIAKDLAALLKKRGVNCVSTERKMQLRLKFYSISKCKKHYLQEMPIRSSHKTNVTISYKNRVLYRGNVTKINNL